MSAEAKFWGNLAALDTFLEARLTVNEALEIQYIRNEIKEMTRNHWTGIPFNISEPINRIADAASKRKEPTGSLDNRFVWGKT